MKGTVLLMILGICLFVSCNDSPANADFEYPYTETIDFNPMSYALEDKLVINGSSAYANFDIPAITSDVVSHGDVAVRVYDDGHWYDVPVEVRHTAGGNPYYEGYIDYSYSKGTLKIINGTTSQDTMSANYFNGGPYEITITD